PLGIFGATPPPTPAAPPPARAASPLPFQPASPLPFDVVGANTEPSVLLHAPSVRARPAPATLPKATATSAAGQEAIAAFLRGAGMQGVNTAQVDTDRFLAECGATVRAAIEGLMGMLLARAKVKE